MALILAAFISRMSRRQLSGPIAVPLVAQESWLHTPASFSGTPFNSNTALVMVSSRMPMRLETVSLICPLASFNCKVRSYRLGNSADHSLGWAMTWEITARSEEHTSELQSLRHLV